jgi:hypothetical protein
MPTLKFFFFKLPMYTLVVQYLLYSAEMGYTDKIEREREGERGRERTCFVKRDKKFNMAVQSFS